MLNGIGYAVAVAVLCCAVANAGDGGASVDFPLEAERLMEEGNYREAYELFVRAAFGAKRPPKEAARCLEKAIECQTEHLLNGERLSGLMTRAEETWPESWRVASILARGYLDAGYMIFPHRLGRRETQRFDNGFDERGRVVAMRLMLKGRELLDAAADPADAGEKADFLQLFLNVIKRGRSAGSAWRLTTLTDIDELPEASPKNSFWSHPLPGAPVDGEGNPLYYRTPPSWEAAANDGERWRFILGELAGVEGVGAARADYWLGTFLLGQFGVQTMSEGMHFSESSDIAGETGTFAVRTLGEDETIARLANGLKRFTMPEEFNHIALLSRAADSREAKIAGWALASLASAYENRQRYDRAAECWRRVQRLDGVDEATKRTADLALKRIVGNNGLFERGVIAPAGHRTVLSYLFRNGDRVDFTAKRLDEKMLFRDIRRRLAAGGEITEGYFLHVEALGRAVLEGGGAEKYVAETAAAWSLELEPLPGHYSRRVSVELPLDKGGCYLVEAAMRDGNTSRMVLWIPDLALAARRLPGHELYYVADAATGQPVGGAKLDFTGYATIRDDRTGRVRIEDDAFAETADADGLVVVPSERLADKNWLVVAEDGDGRMAYLGFERHWLLDTNESGPERGAAFVLTDRPVYRPGQDVNFKAWIGSADYGDRPARARSGSARVRVMEPRGETVFDENLDMDAYGGVSGSLVLDDSATLGQYHVLVESPDGVGSAFFRLEEYKKPEFEVSVDAPAEALELGGVLRMDIRAAYYHGSPVTDAKVSYRVLRTPHVQNWSPPWRWDWLYGRGAWAEGRGHSWYPGSGDWFRIGPPPPWMPWSYQPPEVVAEGEGELDADGVFRLEIDTTPAKELFGHQDHSYTVTAEVTDASRRVIVGEGKAVAARRPFSVAVWMDRGFYAAGDEVQAEAKTLTPLGGGVAAKGKAVLYRIRHGGDGTLSETEVESRDIETDADGAARARFAPGAAGQYRVSFRLADAAGREAEGGALFTARGGSGDGAFRHAALELTPERREYAPGDTVRLAVNSENADATVLLFVRAERAGVAGSDGSPVRPRVLRLDNGSAVATVEVGKADRPNFFCEAVTIHMGRIYTETREIFVPPADKALTVEVTPDRDDYLPGQKADFTVKVTDASGEPVSGQCAVTLYDKSVEYISGGSNAGDIRAHFWSWKRHHNPHLRSSLTRWPQPAEKRGDVFWEPIGVFGEREADWNDDAVYTNGKLYGEPTRGAGFRRQRSAMNSIGIDGKSMTHETDNFMPAPMAAAPMAARGVDAPMLASIAQADAGIATGGGGAAEMAEAVVRGDFADTALWIAALETDAAGRASFSLTMPENLAAWKSMVWVMASGTRVGEGRSEVVTRKNVIVRPQAPRFLTQKDRVVLSANLHNYLPRAKDARVELALEGGVLEAAEGEALSRSVRLDAGGEARVDWVAVAKRPGEARVVMRLLTDEESDAAEIRVPVVVHGARRVENVGGVMRGDTDEAVVRFTVPAERLADQSGLRLSFSPGIAGPLLETLPYLLDYPYGCTEQTLNRFLPAVVVRGFLKDAGVSLADAKRMLEAAPVDAKSEEWKRKWGDARSRVAAVFDEAELTAMVRNGVERLTAMQNADGGWGWFSGTGERSWPHTTAVVVHGLAAADRLGVTVPEHVLGHGLDWLARYRAEQIARLEAPPASGDEKPEARDGISPKAKADNLDAFVHMVLAESGRPDGAMRTFLYRDRLELSPAGLAMLGLALREDGGTEELDMVLRNLSQYVETNPDNGTARLRTPERGWWWWHNDAVETQAWYLKLLSRIDARSDVAAGVARHLLQNRRNGSYWRSTRDTALAVEALAEYAAASGETNPDMTVALYYDGAKVLERKVTRENLLNDNSFILEGVAVEAGEHELRIVRSGRGTLYYTGNLDVFSLEDPIPAAGADLKVSRTFHRLVPVKAETDMRSSTGVAVKGAVERYRREPIPGPFDPAGSETPLSPGDLVEVELMITAANDYEYVVFEDMKAAGLEAVEVRSGYARDALGAYVEYRDRKVTLFVRYLPQGEHVVRYRFRAEVPGDFSSLPTFGGGMYATELFCNSNEMKVRIAE